MKAIKHDKVVAAVIGGITLAAVTGLVVSGLNKSEDIALEANVESYEEVDSEEAANLLSLEGMDNILVGATLEEFNSMVEVPAGELVTEGSTDEAIVEISSEQETETETQEETTTAYAYADTFLANVSEYLNVRAEASADAEVVGKIFAGGGGQVLEKGAEWSKVQSGNVVGYINNTYAWFAQDAEANLPNVCPLIATSTTDNLRLRKGPGTDWKVSEVIGAGTQMTVLGEEGDWLKVSYNGEELYASKEFLSTEYQIGTGMTVEEEQAAIAAEEARKAAEVAAEAERKAKEEEQMRQNIANSKIVETIQTAAYQVTDEDAYLLACVVMAEAGGEPYEGKLAVANIVINRMNSGKYGSTIEDVVYAQSQFSVVTNGALSRALTKGPNAESVQAAADALSGINNVPAYTSFCTKSVASYSRYTEYSIIGNQVFYR